MNNIKKLAGQTAIYGLSSVIGRVLNYLLVPLYTRFFTTTEYGVVTELYAYVAFLVIFLTYGMETAFFRYSKKEDNKQYVYSTTLISLIFSSLVFIFLITINSSSIANWMGYGITKEYLNYFAIIVGVDAVSSIAFAKLRNEEKALRFVSVRLIGIITNIFLNIYFVWHKGFGIEYIFISNMISSLLMILVLLPEIIKVNFIFHVKTWKKMMLYGLPLLIAGLAGIANETLDRIIIKNITHPIEVYEQYIDKKTQEKNTNKKLLGYKKMLTEISEKGDDNTNLSTEAKSFVKEVRLSELGLYGAFYKLSILMILFIQGFRFAAEPFFFTQHKNKENKKVYADVMKYFVIVMIFIFLSVTIFYEFVLGFLGDEFRRDERGFLVVSILLLANLFLGIFYNLSVWYKLTDKTIFGAYLSIFGAIITVVLNIVLIPKIGFIGSAWATLICYTSMVFLSYFLSKKHFAVPYQIKRISSYLAVMLLLYFCINQLNLNLVLNSLFLFGFMIFVYVLEKPKKNKNHEN